MTSRRGFTVIELLTVVVVLGLLAAISILKYTDLNRIGRVGAVSAMIGSIRVAAYGYEADHQNQWPAEVGPGVMPPELGPYLGGGVIWDGPDFTLDWENRIGSGGGSGFDLGVTVTSSDSVLMRKLVQILGRNAPFFVVGSSLTYVLVDDHGNY
jgi:prepilin-type N-terminal cleavage/methylation domain-containing protein